LFYVLESILYGQNLERQGFMSVGLAQLGSSIPWDDEVVAEMAQD
jgi:hypothetical protein